MRIYPILVPDFLTNAYIVSDSQHNAVIIDPGKTAPGIISLVEANKLRLKRVLLTSSAPEHSKGVGTLAKIYSFELCSFAQGLRDGDAISCGELSFKVLHLAGHRLDVLAYYLNDTVLFSGDSLLAGTLASTESYMQRALLIKTVKEKLLPLPDDVFIYPGRGPLSSIALEKMYNKELLETEASFPDT